MSKLIFIVFCFCLIGPIFCETENVVTVHNENEKLSRQKRFPVIGYLSMILGLLNTAMLVISNVTLNNMGGNPNNNFKKRSIDPDDFPYNEMVQKSPTEVLSRQKRTFPVFGFLSFLMLLLIKLAMTKNVFIGHKTIRIQWIDLIIDILRFLSQKWR